MLGNVWRAVLPTDTCYHTLWLCDLCERGAVLEAEVNELSPPSPGRDADSNSELIYPRYLPTGARTEEGFPRPSHFGISDYEECKLITPDGETLVCFLIRPSNKLLSRKVTVLMFHGNAGNIGHRVPIAKVIEEHSGCNIFMLEYRGYGLSTGEPDEAGLVVDAQTALDYIRQHNDTKGNDIIVYGQSIGGAVAVQLVAKNQEEEDVKGLILENTFTSMRKLIPTYGNAPCARWRRLTCSQCLSTCEVPCRIMPSKMEYRRVSTQDHKGAYSLSEWVEG